MRRTRGRNDTLIRALSLMRLLDGRGRYRVIDLAARFDVTTRTIRRDLAAIEAAGYPLASHTTRGGLGNFSLWYREVA